MRILPEELDQYHKAIAEAIPGSGGIYSVICRRTGLSRHTVTQVIAAFHDLQELMEAARQEIVDAAEVKLFEAVEQGKPWAIEKVLGASWARRGYSPKEGESRVVYVLRLPGDTSHPPELPQGSEDDE